MAVAEDSGRTEFIEVSTSEYPEDNILDEDFVKVFEPYRNLQKIFACSRVDVKGRLVTKPTIYQKCYTVFCLAIMAISVVNLMQVYSSRFNEESNALMYYLWMIGISAVLIVFSMNILHARFIDNEGNVKLCIKMQKIDRVMRTNQTINSIHYKRNRRVVIVIAVIFLVILLSSLLLAKEEFGILELVGSTYILETLVFELSICSSHIRFFILRIRLVNNIISNHFKRRHCTIEVVSKESASVDRLPNDPAEWQNFETSATDVYINELIGGFASFQDQYRFQICIFCFVFVAWILFTFEYCLFTLRNSSLNERFMLLDYLLLLSLSAMDLILLFVLCISSELFLREVYKTKQLSVLVMSRYLDGPLRKKAKNMFKLIEMAPPCFSVYGMWRLDVYLLLDIFNIVTTLIVTILQLTF